MQCTIFRDSEKNNKALNEIIWLDKYHPWYGHHNPNFNSFSGSILAIKKDWPSSKDVQYFTDQLCSIISDTEKYVICVMPKHNLGTVPSGIRTIAKRLCIAPKIDGTNVIVRSKETNKKSHGGSRDMELEIQSLSVINENIIKDQQVLLLDDVTTSGTSLKAGKYILEKAGAKLVAMFALGQTQ